jgi:hypothetical protein
VTVRILQTGWLVGARSPRVSLLAAVIAGGGCALHSDSALQQQLDDCASDASRSPAASSAIPTNARVEFVSSPHVRPVFDGNRVPCLARPAVQEWQTTFTRLEPDNAWTDTFAPRPERLLGTFERLDGEDPDPGPEERRQS